MDRALSDTEWHDLLALLHDPDPEFQDDEAEEAAAEQLQATEDPSRIPDLYALLREPGNFWLRELAAEPLARLEGIRALAALLEAQRLGRHERHDNDGLDAILLSLLEAHPWEAAPFLRAILADRHATHRPPKRSGH